MPKMCYNRVEYLQHFGLNIAEKWKALPFEDILAEIKESIETTRNNYPQSIHNIKNDFGIYAFFIQPNEKFSTVERLIEVWNQEGFRKYPKVVKKRFAAQECCSQGWYSFYIGKGEKLKNRVFEHLNHDATQATYGLKLKDRESFLDNNNIEVGYWHLPKMPGVPREIKQFIITNMESRLRDELKPWIGKQ